MVAGRPLNAQELNNTWGGLSTSLFAVMKNIEEAKLVLDGLSVANLITLGFASDGTDANLLKSAAQDMGDIAVVFRNGTSIHLVGTYDYRTFAKQLLGPGLY